MKWQKKKLKQAEQIEAIKNKKKPTTITAKLSVTKDNRSAIQVNWSSIQASTSGMHANQSATQDKWTVFQANWRVIHKVESF